ncbi:DMT family transporter [bacterium]|nr:DMT family transporter [bacterium]
MWSTWGVIVKKLQLDPVQMVFFTTIFSLPAIFVLCLLKFGSLRDNLTDIRQNYPLLALLALSLLLNNFFYFSAFSRTSIAISVFTHYTAPLFVALLAPFMLSERFDRRLVLPLLIASFGLAAILAPDWFTNPGAEDFIGALYGIASGLAYAFTLMFAKRLTLTLKPLTLVFGQSFFISLFLLPFIVSSPAPNLSLSSWIWLLGLGLTHCTLAPLLYLSGLKHIKAQYAAIIGYLEPLAAVILGLLLVHETPSMSIWFGGLLILFSGAIITRLKKRTLK